MAIVDAIITTSGIREETKGLQARMAAKQDDATDIITPCVEATGVTFNGTLDPTNLAIEAGNLQTIAKTVAPSMDTVQKVTIGAAHAETGATIGKTLVMLVSTVSCHIAIADAPVASATTFYLPGNVPMIFLCSTTNKVSVIQHFDVSLETTPSLFVTSLN